MYVQPYSARFKHKINFKSSNGTKYIGDVTSYSDSSMYRISSSLIIQEARIADFPAIFKGEYSSFILAAPHDSRSEITKYLAFLRSNPHKAGLVYFDSAGSSGLLLPLRDNEFHLIGGSDGFRCCIIQLKQKEPEKQVQEATPAQSDRGSEQLAAASHYNDLKRERATRHQSHIFHMRNLNNVIKAEIISSAGMKAKLDTINFEGKILNGVSVIDFGCGMGGDIFKWYKNPAGLSRYVGVDIANNSLKQFTERLISHNFSTGYGGGGGGGSQQGQQEHTKVTHLVCADIGTESLTGSVLDCHTWNQGVSSSSSSSSKEGRWDRRVPLAEQDVFDVASCQFAMHYMFQSAAKAHHFFEQVSRHLKPGGVFIATTMDCRVIAEALSELLHGCFDPAAQHLHPEKHQEYAGIVPLPAKAAPDNSAQDTQNAQAEDPVDLFASIKAIAAKRAQDNAAHNGQKELSYVNDVGSEILRMKFSQSMWHRLLRLNNQATSSDGESAQGKTSAGPVNGYNGQQGNGQDGNGKSVNGNGENVDESAFGIQYTFTLQDSDADAAVDAPEWVVPLGDTLKTLAGAHGLRLLEVKNFQDIMTEMMQNDGKRRKLESMHVYNYKGTISEAEWRIARLYLKLVFVKDREPGQVQQEYNGEPASPNYPPPGYFQPSSPDHPPPGYFQPSSPDHPPPGYFQPSSPDHPPPGYFQPSSPDHPPPGYFQPSSPDHPPPGYFQPSSPDHPPPGYTAAPVASENTRSIGKRARNPYDSDSEPEGASSSKQQQMQMQKVPTSVKKPRFTASLPVHAAAVTTSHASSSNPYGSDSEDDKDAKPNPFANNPFAGSAAAAVSRSDPFASNPLAGSTGSEVEVADANPFAHNPFAVNPFAVNPFANNPFATSGGSGLTKAAEERNKYGSDSDSDGESTHNPFRVGVADAPAPYRSSYDSDNDGTTTTTLGVGHLNGTNGGGGGSNGDRSNGGGDGVTVGGSGEGGVDDSVNDEGIDEHTRQLMELRSRAVALAGGEKVWDTLDDDQIDDFMEKAQNASIYD